jgi:tetratricopeptide (TPR) repeat protein
MFPNPDTDDIQFLENKYNECNRAYLKAKDKESASSVLVCAALDLAIPLQDADPERADELYNTVLDLLENKTEFNDVTFSALARAHVGLGILKSEQAIDPDLGILMDAVDHFVSALDIYQQMGDQENMSNTLLHLGPLHARIGEPEEAMGALTQCLAIRSSVYGENHPLTMVVRHELTQLESLMDASPSSPMSSLLSRTTGSLGSASPSSPHSPLAMTTGRLGMLSTRQSTTLPIYLTSPLTPKRPPTPKPNKVRPSPRANLGILVPAF